jgi:hypothetical protein
VTAQTRAVVKGLASLVEGQVGGTLAAVAVTGWSDAGKPPIADLLRDRLNSQAQERDRYLVCVFEAFISEGGGSTPGAELAKAIAEGVAGERRWWRRTFQPVATTMASPRTRWWRRVGAAVLSAVLAAAIVAIPGSLDLRSLATDGGLLGSLARRTEQTPAITVAFLAALFWFVAVRTWNATNAIARFVSSARDEAATGTLRDVRGELIRLIGQALRRPQHRLGRWLWRIRGRDNHRQRLVVVIQDTDLCADDFKLDLCETAYKLLRDEQNEQITVVLLGDLRGLVRAASLKFALSGDAGGPALDPDKRGRDHIRHLMPYTIPLPPLNSARQRASEGIVSSTQQELR